MVVSRGGFLKRESVWGERGIEERGRAKGRALMGDNNGDTHTIFSVWGGLEGATTAPRIVAIQQFACPQTSQTGDNKSNNIDTCIRARPPCSHVGPLDNLGQSSYGGRELQGWCGEEGKDKRDSGIKIRIPMVNDDDNACVILDIEGVAEGITNAPIIAAL